MKKILLLAILLGNLSFAFSQDEPEVHLESIRNAAFKKITPQGVLGDSAFLEYVIQFIIEESQDVMFLSNRDLLKSLCLSYCGRIDVNFGKRKMNIPPESYEALFDPNLCSAGFFQKPVSAYPSLDGDYLYVYIYGGESSSTYFAKLIFDKKGFIKKIVAEYEDLIQFGAIREEFIGY